MPSKNMLPKGKRRHSVRADYRAARDVANAAEEHRKHEADAALFGEAIEKPPGEPVLPSAPQPPTERRTKSRRQTGRAAALKSAGTPKQKSVKASEPGPAIAGKPSLPAAAQDQQDFPVLPEARDQRLDQFLTNTLMHTSRSRVQLLIDNGQVHVDGRLQKCRYKVIPGEIVRVTGQPQPPPMRATAEDIPLTVVYEDEDLAAIDKPAGMAVHAGSGATEEARTGGTLVNALLYLFQDRLSNVGGELRPGIVHRLDKETSGLILIAKNDRAHRALAEMFHDHTLQKRYIALVHRIVRHDEGTIDLPIARDPVRRTRMTTRRNESFFTTASHGRPSLRHPEEHEEDEPARRKGQEARNATTHYRVLERLHTDAGEFTLLDVEIETGRTHQIRVHMQALGHPVVGDTTYGAPAHIRGLDEVPDEVNAAEGKQPVTVRRTLPRNFLHAAHLSLAHPITGQPLELDSPLPTELTGLLERLRSLRG